MFRRRLVLGLVLAVAGTGAAGNPPVVLHAASHVGRHAAPRCHHLRVPGHAPLAVGRIRLVAPPGGDVTLYRGTSAAAGPAGACPADTDFPAWQDLLATGGPVLDWTLPAGIALGFDSHQRVLLGTAAPSAHGGRRRARVSLFPIKTDDVQSYAGVLFAENRAVVVPPGERTLAARCAVTGTNDDTRDVSLAAIRGDYGAHGVRFEAYRVSQDGSLGELLYANDDGGVPPLVTYSDDADTITLYAGEQIEWRCTYRNDGDATFVAGSDPAHEEHCTLSGLYYPADDPQETIHCVHVGDTGTPCTPQDVCEGGPCVTPAPLTCDDGNPCTDDVCDPVLGCVSTPNTSDCDDGDPCTANDVCTDGTCVGSGDACDDGDSCTEDTCDPVAGCSHAPLDGDPCDDGDACTADDTCVAGVCTGGDAVDCDDGNSCTRDFCVPSFGCRHIVDDEVCEPGDLCTDADCDDGDPCTADVCDPAQGCGHTSIACESAPVTATVEADVAVESAKPDAHLGAAALVGADTRPSIERTFFRVRVDGVGTRTVEGAHLRLHVATVSDAGSDSGGRLHAIGECGWDEAAVTWNAQPAIDGPVLAEVGAVAPGDVADFDVTGAIGGDGVYCFALDTTSANGVDYASREAADGAPEIAVAVTDDCVCDAATGP